MQRKTILIPLIGTVVLSALTGCINSAPQPDATLPTLASTASAEPKDSTASPEDNGIAKLNGSDIVAQTLTAGIEAANAEMSGSYTLPSAAGSSAVPSATASPRLIDSKSVTMSVNGSGTNFAGTFILGDRSVELRRVDNDVYMKANAVASAQLGDPGLSSGFLKYAADDPAVTPWLQFTDPAVTLKSILQSEAAGMTFTTGSTTTVNGAPAVQVLITENNRLAGTLTVAATGKPIPVKLTLADDTGTADLSFTNWTKVPAISAPSSAEMAH